MVAVVFALLLGFPPPQDAKPKPLTREDFDVPPFRIDMPYDSVRGRLGKPETSIPYFLDTTYEGYKYADLVTWRNFSANTLAGIELRGARVATARGVRTGDSISYALRLYGTPGWVGGDLAFNGPFERFLDSITSASLYEAGDYHLCFVVRDTIITRILIFRELSLSMEDFNFGLLKLGGPLDSLGLHLSKPDSVKIFEDYPEYVGSYYPGLVVWRESQSRSIAALDIYSASYPTVRGLRVGDPKGKIEKLYGIRDWVVKILSYVGVEE